MADKKVSELTDYTPPVDTDVTVMNDTTSGVTKKITWANIKAAIGGAKATYDAIVAASGGDYTDIQAAIDAGKKSIFVRDGTYTLTADILFASDVTVLIAESRDTIIACGANYKVNLNGKDDCKISGFKITGTQTTNGLIYDGGAACLRTEISYNYIDASYGIQFGTSSYYAKVINNEITGNAGTQAILCNALYSNVDNNFIHDFGNATANTVVGISVYIATVSNNIIFNIGHANATTKVTGIEGSSNGSTITGNIIKTLVAKNAATSLVYGIYQGQIVTGNYLENIGTSGYNCWGIYGSQQVVNNRIYQVGNTSGYRSIGIDMTSEYSFAVGNVVQYIKTSTSTGNYSRGIQFAASYSICNGNTIKEISGTTGTIFCIYIAASYGCVRDNTLGTSEETASIKFAAYTYGLVVRNNVGWATLGATVEKERDIIYAKNTSGGELAVGTIVVRKAVAAGNEITTTTTGGDDMVLGMVITGAIANNAIGMVLVLGKTTELKVNGTTDIAIGDFISTYTDAGIGKKASAGDTAIAIALEAYATDNSSGVIDALIIAPRKVGAVI